MPIYEIIDYCKHIEQYGLYDNKSISHYYEIQYEDSKVIISLFNTYVINDKIKNKYQEKTIINNIKLKEFCNFVINLYELKLHIGEHSSIQLENILKKIKIKTIR